MLRVSGNTNQGAGNSYRPRRARRRRGRVGAPQAGLAPGMAPPAVARPAPRAAAPHIAAPAAPISYGGAPASSAGADIRATANQQLAGAQGGYREAVFRAAMSLGDPTILAGLQHDPQFAGYQFASDPNSVFNSLARQEKEGLVGIDQASNANNAFFGGFRLQDRGKLSDEVSRDRLGASTDYQNQLKDFAAALAAAQAAYDADIRNANRADTEAAAAREPTPREMPAAPPPPRRPPRKKPKKKKKH